MKKMLSISLVIVMILSLCACTTGNNKDSSGAQSEEFDPKPAIDMLEDFDPQAALEMLQTNVAAAKVEYESKQLRFTGNVWEINARDCVVMLYDGPQNYDELEATVHLTTEELAKINKDLYIDFTGKLNILSDKTILVEDAHLLEPKEIKNLSTESNVIEFEDAIFKFTGAFWNDRCIRLDDKGRRVPVVGLTIASEYTNKCDSASSAEKHIRVIVYQNGKKLTEKCWGHELHPDIDVGPLGEVMPTETKKLAFTYVPNQYISDGTPIKVELADQYGRVLSNLEFTIEDYVD